MTFSEETADSVKLFAAAVIVSIYGHDPKIEIKVFTDAILDEAEEAESIQMQVITKFGQIVIFPNFNTGKSAAYIINRGLVHGMELEGFSSDEIADASIYSAKMSFTKENVALLGYYLAHKISQLAV